MRAQRAALTLVVCLLCASAWAAPLVFVANSGDGTVSVVDPAATESLPSSIRVGDSPFRIASDPMDSTVYVTDRIAHTISVIDVASNSVVDTIGAAGNFGVAVSSDGSTLYAVDAGARFEPVSLVVTSTTSRRVLTKVPLGLRGVGDDQLSVVVDHERGFVYVVTTVVSERFPCRADLTGCQLIVHQVDARTHELVISREVINLVAGFPSSVAFYPMSQKLYVTASVARFGVSGGFPEISTETFRATRIVPKDPQDEFFGVAVAPAGDRLYATAIARQSLAMIDTALGSEVGIVGLGGAPEGVAIDRCGRRVYVTKYLTNEIAVFDSELGMIERTVPVGVGPVSLCVANSSHGTACEGDCDEDGGVSTGEIALGVNIALGRAPISSCRNCDPDHDGQVEVAEMVMAVRNRLSDCAK